mgnify:CR=1 FL=1
MTSRELCTGAALPGAVLTPLTAGAPASALWADAETATVSSQVVRLQYCEQQIVLNDGALFRIELDTPGAETVPPAFASSGAMPPACPLFVDVALLFYEVSSREYGALRVCPPRSKFTRLSIATLHLPDVRSGAAHGAQTLQLGGAQVALARVSVHASLVGVRVRSPLKAPTVAIPVPAPPGALAHALAAANAAAAANTSNSNSSAGDGASGATVGGTSSGRTTPRVGPSTPAAPAATAGATGAAAGAPGPSMPPPLTTQLSGSNLMLLLPPSAATASAAASASAGAGTPASAGPPSGGLPMSSSLNGGQGTRFAQIFHSLV